MTVVIDGTTGIDTVASGVVGASQIASGAVGASQIATGAVTQTKMGSFLVGQVCFFGMSSAPSGFLKCNGAAVSRTTYSALFSAIGTTFGSGDGSTTFNVPDLRGEFIRGLDDGRGVDSGRGLGTAQAQDTQPHAHGMTAVLKMTGGGGGWTGGASFDGSTVTATNNSTGTETRPRNVALLACIFTGI